MEANESEASKLETNKAMEYMLEEHIPEVEAEFEAHLTEANGPEM